MHCVIVIMIVTLHAGKSMMTNMLNSKTMHHSPAHADLSHSTQTLSYTMCFTAIIQYSHHTAAVTHVTTLNVSSKPTSWNSQVRVYPGLYCTNFFHLLPHLTNYYTHTHTEIGLPRLVSSVTNVTRVTTTVTSTGDCHKQVLSSSLPGENTDLQKYFRL